MGSFIPQTSASHNKFAHSSPESKIKAKIIFKKEIKILKYSKIFFVLLTDI